MFRVLIGTIGKLTPLRIGAIFLILLFIFFNTHFLPATSSAGSQYSGTAINFTANPWPIRSCKADKNGYIFEYDEFNDLDTVRVQELLHAHQNPSNCEKAKFFIAADTWPAGFGSAMHVRAMMMIRALNGGRILLEAPDQKWVFSPADCPISSPECYFVPLSKCKLPENWQHRAKRMPFFDSTPLSSASLPQYVSASSFSTSFSVKVFPQFMNKTAKWWIAQLIRYTMRPNTFTLGTVIKRNFLAAFPAGVIPHRIGSIFMRFGDKETELGNNTLPTVDDYFQAAGVLAKKYNVNALYISTDSNIALKTAIRKYSSSYKLFYIPYKRTQTGWIDDIRLTPRAASSIGAVSLADVFIAAQCFFFVGTDSSNQCRLIDEMRLVSGNTCTKYKTIDLP